MKHVHVLLLLLSLFLISCGEDPLSEQKQGDAKGQVNLWDEYGRKITDAGGVTVRFEEAAKSTTTDSRGQWQISGLPAGTYTVTVSKDGFGTHKVFSYEFAGRGAAPMDLVTMVTRASYTIEDLTMTAEGSGLVSVAGRISNADGEDYLPAIVFVGTDAAVSSDPAKHLISMNAHILQKEDGTIFLPFLHLTPRMNVTPGQTYYFIIYPYSSPGTRYMDPHSGKFMYPALGNKPSRVVAVTMP